MPMARQGNHRDRGDAAVGSSVIAFLVAGVLFMASVVAVLVTTRTGADADATGDAPDSAAFQVQAKGLADLLLGSTGYAGSTEFANNIDPNHVSFTGKLADADQVTRLGLLDPDSTEPSMMDFAKFQNLRLAPMTAADDDYVNYEEAAATLGLGSGLDFHIRSYPSLASVSEMIANAQKRDNNLRVAYIADSISRPTAADPGAGLEFGRWSCVAGTVANGAPKALLVSTTVYNNGTTDTSFEGVFDFRFSGSDTESRKRNTDVIDAGTSQAISINLGAIGTRNCNGLQATLKLYDSERLLRQTTTTFTTAAAPTDRPLRALRLDTSSMAYVDTDNVVLDWKISKDLQENDHLIITVCPGLAECAPTAACVWTATTCVASGPDGMKKDFLVPRKEQDRVPWTIDDSLLGPDSSLGGAMASTIYTARLYLDSLSSSSYRATQTIVVTTTALPAYTGSVAGDYLSSDPVATEVGFLEDLMGKFCPTWYDSTSSSPLPTASWTMNDPAQAKNWDNRCKSFKDTPSGQPHKGDVYPQSVLRRVLEDRLTHSSVPKTSSGACSDGPTYTYTNVLVIGSNVDHNKMTSGDVKDCIQDWVLGGGTLIVLGSLQGKTEWLQSTFKVALEGSSTGINVPDTAHPVLHVPNELGWPAYQHSYSWRLKETGRFDSEAAFTRVVNEASADPNAILAVSDPGDFQGGSVILTGWTPYDLNGASANTPEFNEEGRKLLHNLLMLGYRDLYLDYGPALPAFSNVIPAVRGAQICHPEFDVAATADVCENAIDLRLLVYVFPSTR